VGFLAFLLDSNRRFFERGAELDVAVVLHGSAGRDERGEMTFSLRTGLA